MVRYLKGFFFFFFKSLNVQLSLIGSWYSEPNGSYFFKAFLFHLLPPTGICWLKSSSQNFVDYLPCQLCPPSPCWHHFGEYNLELYWLLWETRSLHTGSPKTSCCLFSLPPFVTFNLPFSSFQSFDVSTFKLLPLSTLCLPPPDFSLLTLARHWNFRLLQSLEF